MAKDQAETRPTISEQLDEYLKKVAAGTATPEDIARLHAAEDTAYVEWLRDQLREIEAKKSK